MTVSRPSVTGDSGASLSQAEAFQHNHPGHQGRAQKERQVIPAGIVQNLQLGPALAALIARHSMAVASSSARRKALMNRGTRMGTRALAL